MQNPLRLKIASDRFAAVRVFSPVRLDTHRFAEELRVAGFAPCLGFAPPDGKTSREVNHDSLPGGSVVIVDESSLSSVHGQLQFAKIDLSSLYLVVLAHGGVETTFEEQAAGMPAGLWREYRRVSVLPSDVDEAGLAREAAALVRADRTDPQSALLWIVDDQPHRFHRGGCWADLAEAAQSAPGLRNHVRVVCSLVGREAVMGAARRLELVSIWRQEILEPAARNGTRVVLVTHSRSSGGDTHIGEAWAATVLQWLPSATAFIASAYQIDLRRRPGEGIWIGRDDRIPRSDRERILDALRSRPDGSRVPFPQPGAHPADALSGAPLRAVALSSGAFRDVWPDLLSLQEPEICRHLHEALIGRGPLAPGGREALWEALGWNEELAERLAAAPSELSEWVAAVPEPGRTRAVHAWLAELARNPALSQPPRETPPQAQESSGGSAGAGFPAAPAGPSPPPAPQAADGSAVGGAAGSSPRFTFLSVMDEWSSRRGGLSTFNRELCLALARAGHRVQCMVIHADDAEVREAKQAGVDLLKLEQRPEDPPLIGLHLPVDVPEKPDFILGHGRITGPAARHQERYHPGARRIHFFHMAPEVIEPAKAMARDPGRDFAAVAESRMNAELELARDAALVVAVGPRLQLEIEAQLNNGVQPRPRVYRLDPGIVTAETSEERSRSGAIFCLVSGRVEDFYLKGVDIAAAALGRLAGRARRHYKAELNLLVRGVEPGSDQATQRLLRKHAGPRLGNIRLRAYVSDRAVLAGDLGQASLVLMPSREEGFGLIGLEAIAAGTPVLLTSRSGLAELLSEMEPELTARMIVETSGYDPEDVTRWEDAIDFVLSDRKGAFERAARLRASLASKCTWDQAARGFAGALASLGTQA